MTWKLIGGLAAVLTMFGFVPQILKIIKTKSAKDISLIAILQFCAGVLLWMLYGIHLGDAIIIAANAITLLTLLVALTLYIKYK